jgi:hypothetical protein
MQSGAERTAQTLERIRGEPLALRDFLKRMPKGADLHSHLSGAVYAETHIRDAIADGLCVDQDAKAFAKSQPVIAGAELEPVCEQDQVPATALPKNQRLYNGLVDSFSMRGFVPRKESPGTTISSTRSPNLAAPILATLANGSMKSPLAPQARTSNTLSSWSRQLGVGSTPSPET